jgi:hypothetical protein
MIKTRPQKKTTSQLIKELDEVFSLFVRLRDADRQGTVSCFVTGERIYYKDCDAAHFIDRAHMATRWDEMNVHAVTRDSNRYDPGHKEKYRTMMIVKYGLMKVAALDDKGRSLMKHTSHDLLGLIDLYKEEVKKLRALKKI